MADVKLGRQGLQVSKLGFGCASLTGITNEPLPEHDAVSLLRHVFSKGITFFDTADVYGQNTNEILVGKALRDFPREKFQIATKFGIESIGPAGVRINGSPQYVRACCEASLKRLDLGYIDLYFQHRVDTSVPIEETVGEMKKLVEEGKIKYIGLSEASPDTIRRAHMVHPLSAVEMEWSLWSRDIEETIVPLCRELGIGIVAYSPLGSGFFAGKEFTNDHPRFSGENMEGNKKIYRRLEDIATRKGISTAQLALAWVLHQGDDVVPIPGTTKERNVNSNVESLMVKLDEQSLKLISEAVPTQQVLGDRSFEFMNNFTWQYANTPLL